MSAARSTAEFFPPQAPLLPSDYSNLDRAYISREIADSADLSRVSSEAGKQLVGRSDHQDYAGIVFPYCWPGIAGVRAHRLRRDNPPLTTKRGETKEDAKYLSAPGWSNQLYFHPDTPASALTDSCVPIYFTEGQKKCLALFRLFREMGVDAQPIALNGVWGFRGSTGKRIDAHGQRQTVTGPIPDFDRINWGDRSVVIVFDANVSSNAMVAAARNSLAVELSSRGARVSLIDLAPEDGVNGIDDYLGKHGLAAGKELLETARPFDPSERISKLAYTDAGNERAFEMLHGEDFRYNVTAKQWFRWNGTYWELDVFNEADRAMLTVADARLTAAALAEDEKDRKGATISALRLQNVRVRQAALESATSNRRFARRAEDFDKEDLLFACADGVIDLKQGVCRPGRRDDMITKASPVGWNPAATCSEWERFLCEVFPGNPEMIVFLQRAIGYSLTGLTREEVFFILYGAGRNGKGTFLRVLAEVMGDCAGNTDFSTLIADRENGRAPRNDIASMAGKRFITAQESREGARFDESLIKSLTGGDLITARFLHKEFFTFKPTWKIWLATNHRPDIRGTDTGIWSRPRLIPFDVSFDGREDKGLKDRLLKPESLAGILQWAVRGAQEYLRDGELRYPKAVTEATAEYKADSDVLARFIGERCVTGNGFSAMGRQLYESFKRWTAETGEESISETAFGRRLKERGFEKKAISTGARYQGIGLKVEG